MVYISELCEWLRREERTISHKAGYMIISEEWVLAIMLMNVNDI